MKLSTLRSNPTPLYVVKVGGSLFDKQDLAEALRAWSIKQSPARLVYLAGGGTFVDCIRQADRQFQLGEETSHWLSIDAMDITAKILAQLLPEAQLVNNYGDLEFEKSGSPAQMVFAASSFLHAVEPNLPGMRLPHNWTVTSDSIGARLAESLQADALILLKSTDADPAQSVAEWGAAGLVDAHFPQAAKNVPAVQWINLRIKNHPVMLAKKEA